MQRAFRLPPRFCPDGRRGGEIMRTLAQDGLSRHMMEPNMTTDSYAYGRKDAEQNKQPANLENAPWQVRESYNSGYQDSKNKR